MKTDITKKLKNMYSKDAQIKDMELCGGNLTVTIFYIEPLIDKKLFSAAVISPLQNFLKNNAKLTQKSRKIAQIKQIFSIYSVEEEKSAEKALQKILNGCVVVAVGDNALSIPLFNAEKRGIEEPPTSRVIKGPREGFVEELFVNLGLVRKRLKTINLQIENMVVGKQTNTEIAIVYLSGIAGKELVEKIKSKIKAINIDGIIDSYYIESFLEENKIKFFRRVGNTEKPDIFCSKLLEGRVGILVDGSPIALTAPFVFLEDLQSGQDYFTISQMATFARIMRLVGLFFAILAPGIYVALESYNYRILPINFLISILSSIQNLSVPPLVEIMVVIFLFEIITEASLQMPNSLGVALSIIGALALGNTAVDAGIVSPPSIVVVAVSSVALYIIPDEIAESRLLRIIFTAVGGIIGLYGICVAALILTGYLSSITSFGVPYLAPFAPSVKADKKDGFLKVNLPEMTKRPKIFSSKNKTRIGGKHGEL